jgi:hypothetical protein
VIRDYRIERDEQGRPTRLVWMGDRPRVPKPTPSDRTREKWAQWTNTPLPNEEAPK